MKIDKNKNHGKGKKIDKDKNSDSSKEYETKKSPHYKVWEQRRSSKKGRKSSEASSEKDPLNEAGAEEEELSADGDDGNPSEPLYTEALVAKDDHGTPESPVDPSWEELYGEALVVYQKGVNGDVAAVTKARELFERLREIAPDNNLVKAYYGGTIVLLGRDVANSSEKFRNVMKGLKIIDECIAEEPDSHEIRILRGFVNQRLPELYFQRTAKAADDFAYLVDKYQQDSSILPQDLYWRTLYEWGAANKKLERYPAAQKAWKKLLEESTDDRYRELLKREKKILNRQSNEEQWVETKPKEHWKKRWETELPMDGLELYENALNGNKDAAFQALEVFKKANKENRRNPLIQAYYADCLSLTGKYHTEVPEMIGSTIKSMKMYDSVVNEYPDNISMRLMRAYHSYRLPETFFHRSVTAINDFNELVKRYEADPSVLPENAYWQILYDLGSSYSRMGMKAEAQEVWEKLIGLSPDPLYKELIETQPTDEIPDYSQYSREELYEEGKRLHDLGVSGNRRAAVFARECWRTAHDAYPGDTLAQAYYGSSLALSARDGVEPEQIFRTAYQGLNLLNDAVEAIPEDTEVRMFRAYVLKALPRPFFPSHAAIEDFKILKETYEQDSNAFSRERYDKILEDMKKLSEREGSSFGASEVGVSPVIRELLAGKVRRK